MFQNCDLAIGQKVTNCFTRERDTPLRMRQN
jgi:hypothetical protein